MTNWQHLALEYMDVLMGKCYVSLCVYTVEPLKNGHFGGRNIVHRREVVFIAEVGW